MFAETRGYAVEEGLFDITLDRAPASGLATQARFGPQIEGYTFPPVGLHNLLNCKSIVSRRSFAGREKKSQTGTRPLIFLTMALNKVWLTSDLKIISFS
jgi:hypothetical protein